MGTVKKYVTPGGREGYIARDSWTDPYGARCHKKARFPADKWGGLKKAQKEADAWLAQREADRSRGVLWEASREPFGSLLDRWSAGLGGNRSPSTIAAYRIAAKKRFDEQIRTVPLADLTPARLKTLLLGWQEAKLSDDAISHGFVVLRGALQLAIDERKLIVNPLDGVRRPKRKPREAVRTWSPTEVASFLAATKDDPLGYAWELLFATLVRAGELGALRWDDLDADGGRLTIRRTWSRDEAGRPVIAEVTKTDASARVVPVPPDVLALLAWVRETRATDDGGWIVARDGAPLSLRAIERAWNAAVAATGLPELTPHGARHSGATNLIEAGVPVSVVQRILGHAKPAFTLERYVHPQREALDEAVAMLNGLYRGEISLARAQQSPKVVPIRKSG